jgi:hypothetical protein
MMAHEARTEGPPVVQVAPGDVVYVPMFGAGNAGGAPFWLRIIETSPPEGGGQYVKGVRVIQGHTRQPEADRIITMRLPLDKISRRYFAPVDEPEPPARGVAPVRPNELPRRETP